MHGLGEIIPRTEYLFRCSCLCTNSILILVEPLGSVVIVYHIGIYLSIWQIIYELYLKKN